MPLIAKVRTILTGTAAARSLKDVVFHELTDGIPVDCPCRGEHRIHQSEIYMQSAILWMEKCNVLFKIRSLSSFLLSERFKPTFWSLPCEAMDRIKRERS
jgi:hypothetical protein